MKILVTAGGTREDIDSVRGITNYSTGRLGSIISDEFLREGDDVTYICGENAVLPKAVGGMLKIIGIRSAGQLAAQMKNTLESEKYDCVIHSMAVSDYSPCKVAAVDELSLESANFFEVRGGSKISADSPYMAVILKQTPKVIEMVKKIQPQTTLVGFKLLSNSSEAELVQAGLKLLEKNKCDYVLANDLKNISSDGSKHMAILLNRDGITARAERKEEIARVIFKKIYAVQGGAR